MRHLANVYSDPEVISGFTLNFPFPEVRGITHCGESLCSERHRLPPHAHESIEFMYLVFGTVSWDVGGKRIRQTANELCLINAGEIHATAPDRHSEFKALYVGLDLRRFGRAGKKLAARIHSRPSWSIRAASDFESILRMLFLQALAGPKTMPSVPRKLVELLILMVEFRLGNEWRKTARSNISVYSVSVKKAVDHMKSNLRSRIPMAQLAIVAGRSKSHFSILFRKQAGMSPGKYHRLLRLEAARDSLRAPEASIPQAAQEFGFSSSQHFSALFQKTFRCSPGKWQRHLQMVGRSGAGIQKLFA